MLYQNLRVVAMDMMRLLNLVSSTYGNVMAMCSPDLYIIAILLLEI